MGWQYRKINLNDLPRRRDEIDVLCDAGEHGWELVTILPNNIAYLKRGIVEQDQQSCEPAVGEPSTEAIAESGVIATVTRGSEVKAKYRDPATGETWSGRGRMTTWLKKKLDAGEDIEKYRV
jgi:H-NS histone family